MDAGTIGEFGVIGLSMVVINNLVNRILTSREKKKHGGLSSLACQVDPLHFEHIKQNYEVLARWDRMIGTDGGVFSCFWKDRDEVTTLITALHGLTNEMRRQNNGAANEAFRKKR